MYLEAAHRIEVIQIPIFRVTPLPSTVTYSLNTVFVSPFLRLQIRFLGNLTHILLGQLGIKHVFVSSPVYDGFRNINLSQWI